MHGNKQLMQMKLFSNKKIKLAKIFEKVKKRREKTKMKAKRKRKKQKKTKKGRDKVYFISYKPCKALNFYQLKYPMIFVH